MAGKEITVDWLAFGPDEKAALLLLDAADPDLATRKKWEHLAELGVSQQGDETPAQAYLRHLAEINGLGNTIPAHPALVQVIAAHRGAYWFLFWLS